MSFSRQSIHLKSPSSSYHQQDHNLFPVLTYSEIPFHPTVTSISRPSVSPKCVVCGGEVNRSLSSKHYCYWIDPREGQELLFWQSPPTQLLQNSWPYKSREAMVMRSESLMTSRLLDYEIFSSGSVTMSLSKVRR